MLNWTDIHTHFNMLDIDTETALRNAEDVGVEQFITIGTNPMDLPVVLSLADKYYPKICCTLGIHPHEANLYDEKIAEYIRANATKKYVVAVGEIGLDYYYNNSPKDIQQAAFRDQLQLAKELDLPIEIHTRDAEEDTIEILKNLSPNWHGVIHCFTGTQYLADEALKLGLDISISGVVTFKNAEELRNVVKSVPLERLHVETDSPFLAPVPMRGKKNQPAYVVHVADFLAELKGVSLEDLNQQVRINNLRTFPKLNQSLA